MSSHLTSNEESYILNEWTLHITNMLQHFRALMKFSNHHEICAMLNNASQMWAMLTIRQWKDILKFSKFLKPNQEITSQNDVLSLE